MNLKKLCAFVAVVCSGCQTAPPPVKMVGSCEARIERDVEDSRWVHVLVRLPKDPQYQGGDAFMAESEISMAVKNAENSTSVIKQTDKFGPYQTRFELHNPAGAVEIVNVHVESCKAYLSE